jgi:FO synthase
MMVAGCNDLGGTLINENISRAAGASHGQEMTPERFAAFASSLGRPLEQRTTSCGRVAVPAS